MPRSRILKPSFFTNDRLAELPAMARLLFAGLWTIADREGRLEDRPKRIKGELFPYENAAIERHLGELEAAGFITRYESGGERYIAIPAFAKHQSPHVREPASTIPAPGEHQTSTVLGTNPAPEQAMPSTPISVSLSVSDSVSDPDASGSEPRAPVEKPLPLAKKTAPTASWKEQMRTKYDGRVGDFEKRWNFHTNSRYYAGKPDKCQFLEDAFDGDVKWQQEHGNGNGISLRTGNTSGNGSRRPGQLPTDAERRAEFARLGISIED